MNYADYDFYGAARFNRDFGLVWDRLRKAIERLLPGCEWAKVFEAQARLVLHAHVILRVPAQITLDLRALEATVREVTAIDTIDGIVWSFGKETKAILITPASTTLPPLDTADATQAEASRDSASLGVATSVGEASTGAEASIDGDTSAAQTVRYIAKTIGYMGKSLSQRTSATGQLHGPCFMP